MKKLMYSILCIGIMYSSTFSQSVHMAEIRPDGIQIPVVDHTSVNSPIKGMLVYDINTDSVWSYDGTNWNEVGASTGALTEITDTDNDTKIQVEESGDDDVIRFDLEGVEYLTLRTNAAGDLMVEPPSLFTIGANVYYGWEAGKNNITLLLGELQV